MAVDSSLLVSPGHEVFDFHVEALQLAARF